MLAHFCCFASEEDNDKMTSARVEQPVQFAMFAL
jgi:hypothetical protein